MAKKKYTVEELPELLESEILKQFKTKADFARSRGITRQQVNAELKSLRPAGCIEALGLTLKYTTTVEVVR